MILFICGQWHGSAGLRLSEQELRQFERERADYARLLDGFRHPPQPFDKAGAELICIGSTGGAANVVGGRAAGGFLLRHAGRTIAVDPGDNSMAHLAERGFNPYEITDVLASHAHNDHVGDLSLAVSAAVNLGLAPGSDATIVIDPSLIDYANAETTRHGFTLPAYAWSGQVRPIHWRRSRVRAADGSMLDVERRITLAGGIGVAATEAHHGGLSVTGFLVDTAAGRVGYTSDTEYFAALPKEFDGADVLWINMNTLSLDEVTGIAAQAQDGTRPTRNHLGYVGTCELIGAVRPRTAIVTHFGVQLVDERARIEALLRERFAGSGTEVHCPETGDSFRFARSFREAPVRRRFRP